MKQTLLCLLLALSPVTAGAAGFAPSDGARFDPDKGLDLGQSFAVQREEILRGMEPGGVYGEVDSAAKRSVRDSLARIGAVLEGVGGVEQLSEDAKVRVFNEQEQINELLTDARKDSRLVCRRERSTGSHFRASQCATAAQRRRAQEASAELLRNAPSQQPKRGP